MDNLDDLSQKRVWRFSLFVLLLIAIFGCYFWPDCKDLCINLIIFNYSTVIHSSFIYIKKASIVLALFILFKIIQHIIINKFLKKIMQNIGSGERYISITKIANFVLWIIFIFAASSSVIGNVTALLASLGLVGFGLTFALQKPILNFVGWLTIILKDLYHEGDRIKINNVLGDVKEIQMMNTIVEGLLESSDVLSGKTISFPNELILSTDVQNFTKDSNYIVNELSISITYESDYRKAMKLLKEIIILQVTKNKQKYIKRIAKQKMQLNVFVNKWLTSNRTVRRREVKQEKIELEKIKHEKETLENDLKSLEDEFIPLIRIEMLDSAIQLIAQFKSPYNEVKKNRTEINLAFLDALEEERDIEIAYPHMQFVKHDKR